MYPHLPPCSEVFKNQVGGVVAGAALSPGFAAVVFVVHTAGLSQSAPLRFALAPRFICLRELLQIPMWR